jgi:hypothetical protein
VPPEQEPFATLEEVSPVIVAGGLPPNMDDSNDFMATFEEADYGRNVEARERERPTAP